MCLQEQSHHVEVCDAEGTEYLSLPLPPLTSTREVYFLYYMCILSLRMGSALPCVQLSRKYLEYYRSQWQNPEVHAASHWQLNIHQAVIAAVRVGG